MRSVVPGTLINRNVKTPAPMMLLASLLLARKQRQFSKGDSVRSTNQRRHCARKCFKTLLAALAPTAGRLKVAMSSARMRTGASGGGNVDSQSILGTCSQRCCRAPRESAAALSSAVAMAAPAGVELVPNGPRTWAPRRAEACLQCLRASLAPEPIPSQGPTCELARLASLADYVTRPPACPPARAADSRPFPAASRLGALTGTRTKLSAREKKRPARMRANAVPPSCAVRA